MAKKNGRGWKPIETVPRDTLITLKTARGKTCMGKVLRGARFMPAGRGYAKRIPAKRLDLRPPMQGDVRAVAWR